MLEQWSARAEAALDSYLSQTNVLSKPLYEATSYGVFNGGKRFRPALVYAAVQWFAGETPSPAQLAALDGAACAVELMHSYSLVHDDLPAMDNAELRRGAPSCHRKFGEALAILAGDGLQVLAIQSITQLSALEVPPAQVIAMLDVLLAASGPSGMVGGQAQELSFTESSMPSLEDLKVMYHGKTGALLTASLLLGALAAGTKEGAAFEALEQFGESIGLAFQIHDDCLDLLGDTEQLGKPAGLDLCNEKITFPHLLGLERAQALRDEHYEKALAVLEPFGDEVQPLRALAHLMVTRNH